MIFARIAIVSLVLGVPCSASASDTPAAAEWPGWRGLHRDGKSSDKGLLRKWPKDGPSLLWKTSGLGKGFSSVAVTGGVIYTAGDIKKQMKVFALDAGGKPLWQTEIDEARGGPDGSRSTPVI